jgi:PEP-CTERM motif
MLINQGNGFRKLGRLMKYSVLAGGLLATAALAGSLRADTLTFSAGNYSQTGLLNDGSQGTDYDILSMTGLSGSASVTNGTPVTLAISAVTFTDGPSCYFGSGCNGVSIENGTASFSMTVDGVTQTLNIPFQACLTPDGGTVVPLCPVTNPTDDTIQLYATGPVVFDVSPTEQVTLTTLNLGPVAGSSGGTTQDLYATFVETPEPSSLLLLGLGLFSLLLMARKFGHRAANEAAAA